MPDPVVQDVLQVVSARGRAKQAKQNMFEAHANHYITYYVNVNRFGDGRTLPDPPCCWYGEEAFRVSWAPRFQRQEAEEAGRCVSPELLTQRRTGWARTKFSIMGVLDKRTNF
jgi:hypothetical protein